MFPKIPAPNGINVGFSDCAKYNLAARPRKGDGRSSGTRRAGCRLTGCASARAPVYAPLPSAYFGCLANP